MNSNQSLGNPGKTSKNFKLAKYFFKFEVYFFKKNDTEL